MEQPKHHILQSLDIARLSGTERAGLEEFALATGHASLEELLVAFAQSPQMQDYTPHSIPERAIHTLFLSFIEDLCAQHGISDTVADDPQHVLLSEHSPIGKKLAEALGFDNVAQLHDAVAQRAAERAAQQEEPEGVYEALEHMAHAVHVDIHLLLFGHTHASDEEPMAFEPPTEWHPERTDDDSDAA